MCYSNPANDFLLECANGNFTKPWNGCIDQGSVRVRCPLAFVPCNYLAVNGIEFRCRQDCTEHGGVKDCLAEGTFFNIGFILLYSLVSREKAALILAF